MDSLKDVAAGKKMSRKRDPKLHSAAHVLADELANLFNDRAHFGFYLKMAVTHSPDVLRKIAGEIMENPKVKTPGKLFAYLIKKHHDSIKENLTNGTPSRQTSSPRSSNSGRKPKVSPQKR